MLLRLSKLASEVVEDEENYGWKAFRLSEEKRQQLFQSKWGGYALHLRLWEDSNAPVTKIRGREDIVLDNLEYCGILSDRMVGACSSFLTVTPANGRYVLSKCNLQNMASNDVPFFFFQGFCSLSQRKILILRDRIKI